MRDHLVTSPSLFCYLITLIRKNLTDLFSVIFFLVVRDGCGTVPLCRLCVLNKSDILKNLKTQETRLAQSGNNNKKVLARRNYLQ